MAYHRPLDAYEEYIARKREREAETLADTKQMSAIQLTPDEFKRMRDRMDGLDLLCWVFVCGVVTVPLVPFVWGYLLWLEHKYPGVRRQLPVSGGPVAVSIAQPPQSS